MGNSVSGFKGRSPSSIQPNTKIGDNAPTKDIPSETNRKLPNWAKLVIGSNIVMVHVVVILVGITDVPFTLSDASLAAYIVIAMGMPVGLANQTVRSALVGLFAAKS